MLRFNIKRQRDLPEKPRRPIWLVRGDRLPPPPFWRTRYFATGHAGEDLVIHYAADGEAWLWEIEHASAHPEHIAAALDEIRESWGC